MKIYTPNDFEIEFVINGVTCGSGTLMVRDGVLLDDDATDAFFATLRKNATSLIEEAKDEEKAWIVDNLTPEQEDKLKEAHAKDYHGTDDDMPDDYEDWLIDLSLEEIKAII